MLVEESNEERRRGYYCCCKPRAFVERLVSAPLGASVEHAVSRTRCKRTYFKTCVPCVLCFAVYDDQPVTQSIDERLEFCGNCAVCIMRIAVEPRPQAQDQRSADIRGDHAPRNPKLWVTQTTSAVSLEPTLPMVFRSTFTAHSTFVLATASVIWSA